MTNKFWKYCLSFFQISILGSFAYISRSGITGSKGRSIFNVLRYLCTAFHSGCTSLLSHQQCKRVPLFYSNHETSFPFVSFQVSRDLPVKQGEIEAHVKDLGQIEEQLNHLLLWLSPIRHQLEILNQPNQTGPFDIKVGTCCFKCCFPKEWQHKCAKFLMCCHHCRCRYAGYYYLTRIFCSFPAFTSNYIFIELITRMPSS